MEAQVQDLVEKGIMLPLMEEFYTIQGEGYHKGAAAYFIRVGGCDVGCHWCDVKESWNPAIHPPTEIKKIAVNASKFSKTIVTSGAYPLSGTWDWICLSPKKLKLPTKEIYQKADELKIIIYNKDDFKFAEEQAAKVDTRCKLYLQPEWSKREKMIPEIVAYVMQNPKWVVSLQTHKYLNIP